LEDPGVDGRIILRSGIGGMDWIDLAQEGLVAGTCECGNEPLGSIKCGEFLDYLRNGQLSRSTLLHGVSQQAGRYVS